MCLPIDFIYLHILLTFTEEMDYICFDVTLYLVSLDNVVTYVRGLQVSVEEVISYKISTIIQVI